jgi:hypothetical protein
MADVAVRHGDAKALPRPEDLLVVLDSLRRFLDHQVRGNAVIAVRDGVLLYWPYAPLAFGVDLFSDCYNIQELKSLSRHYLTIAI